MQSSSEIPIEAQELGKLIEIYRVSLAQRIVASGVILGLGAPLFVCGLWLIAQRTGLGILVAGAGVLLIGLPVWIALRDTRSRGRVGYLFADGFCYVDVSGEALAARWDEIDQLWVLPSSDNIVLTIQKTDGSKFTLSDSWLRDYHRFVRAIEEQSASAKLPGIRRRLDNGAQVCFGPLTMTRTGLIKESYIFPIAELDEVGVERQPGDFETSIIEGGARPKVRIVHRGKSFDWPDLTVADIANFHAMMTVLEEHGKARQPYY